MTWFGRMLCALDLHDELETTYPWGRDWLCVRCRRVRRNWVDEDKNLWLQIWEFGKEGERK